MNLLKVFSACVAVVSVCQGNAAPADTVVASSYGWNPTNATKCLQAALDSGAKKVIVDKQASEWLVDMMYPRSNTEIVFQDGVIVRARPGSMKRNIDNLFRCKNVSNIVMRGEGRAILRMNREDYFDRTRYMRGEHRHAVSLHNAQNMVVRDLTLEDSGGDGVYVLNVKKALLEILSALVMPVKVRALSQPMKSLYVIAFSSTQRVHCRSVVWTLSQGTLFSIFSAYLLTTA